MAFLMSSVRAAMEKAGKSTAKYADDAVRGLPDMTAEAPMERFARDGRGRLDRIKSGRRFSKPSRPGASRETLQQFKADDRVVNGLYSSDVNSPLGQKHRDSSPLRQQYRETARKNKRAGYQAAKQTDAAYVKQEEAFQEKARLTGMHVQDVRVQERAKWAEKNGQDPDAVSPFEHPTINRPSAGRRFLASKDPSRSKRGRPAPPPVDQSAFKEEFRDPVPPKSEVAPGGMSNPQNVGRADLLDLLKMGEERPNAPLPPPKGKVETMKDAVKSGSTVAEPVLRAGLRGIGSGIKGGLGIGGGIKSMAKAGFENLAFPLAGGAIGGAYNFATYDSSKETDPYRQQNTVISRLKSTAEGAVKGAGMGAALPVLSGVLKGVGSTLVDEETRAASEAYGKSGSLARRFFGGIGAAGGAKTGDFGDLNERVQGAVVDNNPLMGFAAAKKAEPGIEAARKKVAQANSIPGHQKFADETKQAFESADENAPDYEELFEMAGLAEEELKSAQKSAIKPEEAAKLQKEKIDPYERGERLLSAVEKPQVGSEARAKIEADAKKAGKETKPEDFIDGGQAIKNMAGLTMMNAGNTLATAAGTAVGGTSWGIKSAVKSYQENVIEPTKEGQKTVDQTFGELSNLPGSRNADQEKLFQHLSNLKKNKKGGKLVNPFYQYDDAKPAVLGRSTDPAISPTTSRNYIMGVLGAGVGLAAMGGAAMGGFTASGYGAPAGHPLNVIGNSQKNAASSRAQMEADAAQKVRMTRPNLIGLNDTEEAYYTNPNMKPARKRHDPGMYNDDGNLVFALSALRRG